MSAVMEAGQRRMRAMGNREVGFSDFNPNQVAAVASHELVLGCLLPRGTYVARVGKNVLIGFHDLAAADLFFAYAMRETL
jgi:hypothetical protein